jgi:hypothetical protein
MNIDEWMKDIQKINKELDKHRQKMKGNGCPKLTKQSQTSYKQLGPLKLTPNSKPNNQKMKSVKHLR